MPKFLIAVIVVLVIGCRKGNLLSPAEEAQGFFPLAEGNTWVYESHFSWEPDTTLVREVTLGHQQIDTVSGLEYYNPTSTFSYARFASSRPVWCTVLAKDSRGIYAVFTPGTSPFYTALLRFIDYPVMVGKSWIVVEGNTTFDGGSYRLHKIFRNIRTILGIESVTVPAGMFPFCYHIADSVTYREDYITSTDSTTQSYQSVSNEWFVPYTGLVKQMVSWNQYENTIRNELRMFRRRLSN